MGQSDTNINGLWRENAQLRQQVASLTKQRDALLLAVELAVPVMDAYAGDSRLKDFRAAAAALGVPVSLVHDLDDQRGIQGRDWRGEAAR
jgi:hypothetical protein